MSHLSYPLLGDYGRLGNQLWEIASTLGISHKLGCWADFNRWDYEPYFRVPSGRFTDCPTGDASWVHALNLPESERPYLQDFSLWSGIEDAVRAMFSPSDLALEQLDDEYDWFFEIPNRVALHIRRDERVEQFAQTHPTPPRAYYEKAMGVVYDLIKDPQFCVFSDDIEWCKSNLPSEMIFIQGYPRRQGSYLDENESPWKDYLDLFLMGYCQDHIIANSTFSWWGAYLSGNRHPIYPAVWYGSYLVDLVDWRLQIPPGWTEVGW